MNETRERTPTNTYAEVMDELEDLYIYEGVSTAAIAKAFGMNKGTLSSRFVDVGAGEVRRMRDQDTAEDKALELILAKKLPSKFLRYLTPDRQAQGRDNLDLN